MAPGAAELPVEKPKAVQVVRREPKAPAVEPAPLEARPVPIRVPEASDDLGEMLLQVVGRATVEADAKAERLRAAVLKAIEVLREAAQ